MIYDGFAFLSKDRNIPFHFESGYLELFLGGSHFTFEENTRVVVGQKRGVMAGGLILFHLSLPLDNYGMFQTIDEAGVPQETPISIGTVRQEVDFYIDGYVENSKFTKMKFSFPELDFFIPSSKMCNYFPEDSRVEFLGGPEIITSFPFEYKGRTVNLMLKLSNTYKFGIRSHAETESLLVFEFYETDELDFFLELYYLVQFVFSFLCNRQNIALDNAVLTGKSLRKGYKRLDGTEIVKEKEIPASSNYYVLNKYKEENEDSNVIAKTIRYSTLASAFVGLFSLFLGDKVSVLSIHSSRAVRNLLDLKQCLHITAAFEYYQRTFLPEISSEVTIQVYDEVRALVEEYVNLQSGDKKRKAKRLFGSISPTVSLKDKICKVYNGYDSWLGLKTVLFEYFGEDVTELAGVANQWRNELAHEKREYEPDRNVISSVRLVEHLNYCIVLRLAGYSDDVIKRIIEEILTR